MVVIADTPKVMTDGNWRLGTVIDAKASDEQAEKLQAVFSGELGGPMAALGPLIGENLGVQRAPIEVRDDGLRHSVRIGDATGFDVEDVVPFGVETGEPARVTGIFHPAGSEFRVAKAKSADISLFGIEYQGKSALSAPRNSRGPPDRVTAPAGGTAAGFRGCAHPARPHRAAVRARGPRVVVHGRPDARHGRRARAPTWARSAWFLGIWVVMMAAMMFPSVAPTVALYSTMTKKRSPFAPLVFASGYLLTWAAAGLLAFGVSELGRRLFGDALAWDRAGRWVAGGILVVAAVYELTPLKTVCLRHCRSPLGFLLGSWRDGLPGALQMGAKHGAWCVGCCWALMASLFALGVMSIAWMAFVAALIAAEKTLPWGRAGRPTAPPRSCSRSVSCSSPSPKRSPA